MKIKFLLFILLSCFSIKLLAQEEATPAPDPVAIEQTTEQTETPPNIVTEILILAGVAILPFAVMLLTSYIKIIIVLSLLRNALGVQNSPPNQVLNGIALLMTLYVMYPTITAMYDSGLQYMDKTKESAPQELFSPKSAGYLLNLATTTKEPLKQFLEKNTIPQHISSFHQLAYKSFPADVRSSLKYNDMIILVPAFITSQLKTAFEIGVLIYLPFFVIDLVVSNILLAMGMMMLSPLTISLPIKLLLIVMVDGWTLIIQGLVMSFR